jgi:hypothetical protein
VILNTPNIIEVMVVKKRAGEREREKGRHINTERERERETEKCRE